MAAFFRIVYGIYLGFCVIGLIMGVSMSYDIHSVELLGLLFITFACAILPYFYFLFIFKIPVDFEIWCGKNTTNINSFKIFFKHYPLWIGLAIVVTLISPLLLVVDWLCVFFVFPHIWLCLVFLKKALFAMIGR